jgi:hypothetical protein
MSSRVRNRTISPSRNLRKPLSSVAAWDRGATTSTPVRAGQGSIPNPFQPSSEAVSLTSQVAAEDNQASQLKRVPLASTESPMAPLSSSISRGSPSLQASAPDNFGPATRIEGRSKLSQVMSASSRPVTAPSLNSSSHSDSFGIIASDSLLGQPKAQPAPASTGYSTHVAHAAPPVDDLQSSFAPQPMQPLLSPHVRPSQTVRFAAPGNNSGR